MQIKEVDVEKTEIFSIGRQYSHNVLVIHFVNLPNLKNKYIYYKIDDIEEEIPLVSDLFIVSRPLTMHSGKVKAQIIVRDEANETIGLTKNFTMIIKASNYSGIGEDENYPDDLNVKNYFVKIDEKVNSFEELANLVQTKLDNGEFIGAQGPKGDPGDVTEEYRNLAMQIAQNASDAQTSATNAQVSATDAQRILDDTKEFANQTKTELNQIKNDTSALKDEANASAVNAKASENKAKEYANNLQASTDDISQLKEDLGNKAPAIIEKSAGKTIIIEDSSNLPVKALSGTGEIIVTGKNILKTEKYNVFIPFEAKAGTLFTMITNGEFSEGGNVKFIDENGENIWFAIDKGQTKKSLTIRKNIKGYVNLLSPKEGLKYCLSAGENDEYEEYVEQVITAPVNSEQLKAIHTNYPITVLTSENEISVEYVADTKHYIDKKFEELNQAIVNTQIALL